jgi:DoxX-like family
MSTDPPPASESKVLLWIGRVLSALPALMIAMGGVMAATKQPMALEGMSKSGYDPQVAPYIGIAALVSVVLYAIPQTAVLGAILLTGYLGGAVATHVRVGEGFAPAVIVGVLVWSGLVLRDSRLRSLLPWRRS